MSCASSISTPKQKGELYLASSLCDGLEDHDLKQVTTLLKSKEADPNVLMPLHGVTPFHLLIGNDSEAFAEEVTRLFLRHGGNPNVKSVDGMTPVHVAAAWGRARILELLLANGGDPLCLDSDCCSPFNYAFQGEHYEAVQVLSKYCIKEEVEDEDDEPKYKRELDKVIVNNGDVLAEYIVSSDSSFNSSFSRNSFSSEQKNPTSGYVPESTSTRPSSIASDYVTVRRKLRKRLAQDEANHVSNVSELDKFDFKRETDEEEMRLINEIISQLSSSVASETDLSNLPNNNKTDAHTVSYKASSPKRMQMTMTFNRPKNCNVKSNLSTKKNVDKFNSTLQVIKKHNYIPDLRTNKTLASNIKKPSTVSDKHLVSKNIVSTSSGKITPSISKTPVQKTLSQRDRWLNETIISKSPNLIINTNSHEKKKRVTKTPIFEKKTIGIHSKVAKKPTAITPNKNRSKSPNQLNNIIPFSRIPRPKKYFVTPTNIRTFKRTKETPTNTIIPLKRKAHSTKKQPNSEKIDHTTSMNQSKSASSTPSLSADNREFSKNRYDNQSFRNVAVNLYSTLYDNDEEDITKDRDLDPSAVQRLEDAAENYFSTLVEANLKTESEVISGVGMLSSEIMSKTNSKIDDIADEEDEKPTMRDSFNIDLNHAILDSLSHAGSRISKSNNIEKENDNLERMDKTGVNFDSLLCEKGSDISDLNDSFLSLDKLSNTDHKSEIVEDAHNKVLTSSDLDFITLEEDSSSSLKKLSSETFLSMEEEYKYEDTEKGVAFLERRLCVTPPCATSDMNTSFYSCSTTRSEPLPRDLFLLDNVMLRERLKNLGENPGPITETTHRVYLKRLHKLEKQGRKPIHSKLVPNTQFRHTQSRPSLNLEREKDLINSRLLSIEWIKDLKEFEDLEQKVFQDFASPNPSRKWREGTSKSSFNYLLLDPRITKNLPRKSESLSASEKWETFLSAVFYIGKGKKSRPYEHLYDAFKIWVSKDEQDVNNAKIQRILDIWNEGKGVIVLHVFHNTIPVEAYTREAAMIQALGTQKLGNRKHGDYYGIISTWRSREKCDFGKYLLYKAMQILLIEGERQIFPDNL